MKPDGTQRGHMRKTGLVFIAALVFSVLAVLSVGTKAGTAADNSATVAKLFTQYSGTGANGNTLTPEELAASLSCLANMEESTQWLQTFFYNKKARLHVISKIKPYARVFKPAIL